MNNKITKYLTGGNPNLYGTIISFNKGWRKKNPDFIDHYAFLLYFSHETGRIERFLYNSGNKNNQIFDNFNLIFKEDDNEISKFPYNKKNNAKIIHENINELSKYINNIDQILEFVILTELTFKSLNNGKFTNSMLLSFLFELLRDYFIYQQSYHYCDMNILRKYTEAKDNITNNTIK